MKTYYKSLNAPEELKTILLDNTSGSFSILFSLNNWFRKQNVELISTDFLNELQEHFSQFEAVKKYLSELLQLIHDEASINLEKFCKGCENKLRENESKLLENAVDKLKYFKKFLTISNSSSVVNTLIRLHKLHTVEKVLVCESRPMFEGRIAADILVENGIPTELITEAMISKYLTNVETAVFGADKILANGDVINKTGSGAIAIICKYYNIPVFVIANSGKFSPDLTFSNPLYPAEEIRENNKQGLEINNYYFERIDHSLVTEVITE